MEFCVDLGNHYLQDEKALYDAARRGDVSTVRRLVASNVNINCTPHPVCKTIIQ